MIHSVRPEWSLITKPLLLKSLQHRLAFLIVDCNRRVPIKWEKSVECLNQRVRKCASKATPRATFRAAQSRINSIRRETNSLVGLGCQTNLEVRSPRETPPSSRRCKRNPRLLLLLAARRGLCKYTARKYTGS